VSGRLPGDAVRGGRQGRDQRDVLRAQGEV